MRDLFAQRIAECREILNQVQNDVPEIRDFSGRRPISLENCPVASPRRLTAAVFRICNRNGRERRAERRFASPFESFAEAFSRSKFQLRYFRLRKRLLHRIGGYRLLRKRQRLSRRHPLREAGTTHVGNRQLPESHAAREGPG
jgi:hypothetical protein